MDSTATPPPSDPRLDAVPPRATPLHLGGAVFDSARPAVMAIVNRTRDSFFPDNRFVDDDAAFAAVDRALAEGADLIDVGGVRAGQEGEEVDTAEEVRRVVPFIASLRARFPNALISIDTWRSEVLAALAAEGIGVDLVNDTWQGYDPDLVAGAADLGVAYVVSHSGGLPPRTDPVGIRYDPEPHGVLDDVERVLLAGARRAQDLGLPPEKILLDPTLDFGKRTAHSLTLLRHTGRFARLGYPTMQALSRKDFVGESLDLPVQERLEGTLAATAIAAWQGCALFRAHDVRATRRLVDMVAIIRGDAPPALSARGA